MTFCTMYAQCITGSTRFSTRFEAIDRTSTRWVHSLHALLQGLQGNKWKLTKNNPCRLYCEKINKSIYFLYGQKCLCRWSADKMTHELHNLAWSNTMYTGNVMVNTLYTFFTGSIKCFATFLSLFATVYVVVSVLTAALQIVYKWKLVDHKYNSHVVKVH